MKFFEKLPPKLEKEICIDCDKKNQKDLPSVSTSGEGMPCELTYTFVTKCMNKFDGQISPCAEEWDAFRQCHKDEKKGDAQSR